MAYEALLSVAGNDVKVFEFSVSLHQAVDNEGKPASGVFTGDIFLIVEGGNDVFFEWLCDQTRMESGNLKTKQTDQESTFVEYAFEKAFLTDIGESFIDDGGGFQNEFNRVTNEENDNNQGLILMNRIRGRELDYNPLMSAYSKARGFQRRTANSYVLFFSLSCEKIRVRDIEHNNQWGK
jgi:hypothetical protein